MPGDHLPPEKSAVETANGEAARNLTAVLVNYENGHRNFMGPRRYLMSILIWVIKTDCQNVLI